MPLLLHLYAHAAVAFRAARCERSYHLLQWMLQEPLGSLMAQAAQLRDARGDRTITFSPKAFLPLTKLCRDSCKYCTFAQPPQPGRRAYMTLPEVLQIADAASAAGCTEALLTLGDKPELRYPEAQRELHSMGFESTIAYVRHICSALLVRTALLPHVNAGVMTRGELAALRHVSASQGLMLETTAAAVMQPGGAHEGCPDKEPAARLRTIELAGAATQAPMPYLALRCTATVQPWTGNIFNIHGKVLLRKQRVDSETRAQVSCKSLLRAACWWASARARATASPTCWRCAGCTMRMATCRSSSSRTFAQSPAHPCRAQRSPRRRSICAWSRWRGFSLALRCPSRRRPI